MSDIVERLADIACGTAAKPIGDREWCIDAVRTSAQAAAEITRLRSLVEEAGKEIGWQDVRLAAGEGPLKGRDVFGAVNVILNQRRRSLLTKLKGEA